MPSQNHGLHLRELKNLIACSNFNEEVIHVFSNSCICERVDHARDFLNVNLEGQDCPMSIIKVPVLVVNKLNKLYKAFLDGNTGLGC